MRQGAEGGCRGGCWGKRPQRPAGAPGRRRPTRRPLQEQKSLFHMKPKDQFLIILKVSPVSLALFRQERAAVRRERSSELEWRRLMSPRTSQSHVCRASSTPSLAAAALETRSEPLVRAQEMLLCVGSAQNLQQLWNFQHEHVNELLFKTTNKLDSWNLRQHSLVCVCVWGGKQA